MTQKHKSRAAASLWRKKNGGTSRHFVTCRDYWGVTVTTMGMWKIEAIRYVFTAARSGGGGDLL